MQLFLLLSASQLLDLCLCLSLPFKSLNPIFSLSYENLLYSPASTLRHHLLLHSNCRYN